MADAAAYHRLKRRYLAASILLQLAFFSSFLAFDLTTPLLRTIDRFSMPDAARRLAFLFFFYLAGQLALFPIRYLSGWKLEKDFRMLKQGLAGWLSDLLKSQALSFAVFAGSASVFFAVVGAWPSHAWWILAVLTFLFSAFASTLFPVLILPLFYRTAPLNDAALVGRLQSVLARCGFPDLPLYEIRLGDKTARANAMLTGFGRTRRALLSDTLLAAYTAPEIEMVLAHESGHHAHGHLWRSLFYEALSAAAAFLLLFGLSDILLSLSGASGLVDLRFFPVLALLAYAGGLAALPAGNTLSRSHEREADRFALRHCPDLATFSSLMEKLSTQNLANPSPGRWEEALLYTHPSKRNRIAHAERFVRTALANSRRAD